MHPTDLLSHGGFLRNFHNQTLLYELNGEKVAVSGMGSVPEDLAREGLKAMTCKPVQGAFNVFVLHQSFQELDVSHNEQLISFEDLPEGYDLYLCGHSHKQNLSGKALNPGSTVVTQLREDETGQRGWLLYDTASRTPGFRPIKSRELFRKVLEFREATPGEIRAGVEKEAASAVSASPSALVKIIVQGTLAPGFHPVDIRLPEFGDNVYIDNSMNAESLRERISQIKLSREQKKSSKEVAMRILRQKLQGTSYSLGDPEKVFESLLDKSFLKAAKERIEKGEAAVST
ncbi:Uncharacterised protein [uncultured archaeon]|nr:Uncharacterised protein [uncultured archaeon]